MNNALPQSHEYDLIVFGGGCAGLSLLTRLVRAGWTRDRKVLLVERDAGKSNDRTWCFWEKEPGFFEDIVYKKWEQLTFHDHDFSGTFALAPYTYKLIRGIDFYQYCHHAINGIERFTADISDLQVSGSEVQFKSGDQSILLRCPLVFNSIPGAAGSGATMKLLQHFRGWVVETSEPVFTASVATFMDFRVSQDKGTAFVYVLPFNERRALVEYTLFSGSLLPKEDYESGLRDYLSRILDVREYKIVEEEAGVIPMTNQDFPFYRNGMYHIGTTGGQTKASSGYTFHFIQKQAAQIVRALTEGKELNTVKTFPSRFRFYDNTLLYVLYHGKLPGSRIFATLFRKNKVKDILAFLDNESTVLAELKIISSLPTLPFLKAAIRH